MGLNDICISQAPVSRIAYSARKCRHLVVSPPKGVLTEDMGLAKSFDIFSKHIKTHFPDLIAGEIVFHPFRIREEIRLRLIDYCKQKQIDEPSYSSGGFWKLARDDVLDLGSFEAYRVFSPHAHVICFGRFPNAKEYHEQTGGWVYKNIRDLPLEITIREDGTHNDAVNTVFAYLLTHCCVEINDNGRVRKCHRSFGLMSPRYFRRSEGYCIVLESTLKCPECLEKGKTSELVILSGEKDELPKVETFDCCWYDKPKTDIELAYTILPRVPIHTRIPNYDLHTPKPRQKKELREYNIPEKVLRDIDQLSLEGLLGL